MDRLQVTGHQPGAPATTAPLNPASVFKAERAALTVTFLPRSHLPLSALAGLELDGSGWGLTKALVPLGITLKQS